MTSPDQFPTPDTTTPAPSEADVRIRPVPGRQQETARLLLAAAGDDPQLVRYHPPHFIVPREVAEDAGLLEQEAPSPHVVSHDRTVPFPPLYPGHEAHTMTPLAPPGERALTVAPGAGTRDGLRPAEAPGDFLPDAADQVRSFDSTGGGESADNVTGRRSAHAKPEVLADNAGLVYPNVFAHTDEDEGARAAQDTAPADDDAPAGDDDPGPASHPVDGMTVAEIEAALSDGTLTPADVRAAELAGKNRKGVLSLVEE